MFDAVADVAVAAAAAANVAASIPVVASRHPSIRVALALAVEREYPSPF